MLAIIIILILLWLNGYIPVVAVVFAAAVAEEVAVFSCSPSGDSDSLCGPRGRKMAVRHGIV